MGFATFMQGQPTPGSTADADHHHAKHRPAAGRRLKSASKLVVASSTPRKIWNLGCAVFSAATVYPMPAKTAPCRVPFENPLDTPAVSVTRYLIEQLG